MTGTPPQLMIIPTGAGEARPIEVSGLRTLVWGEFNRDGSLFVVLGAEEGRSERLTVLTTRFNRSSTGFTVPTTRLTRSSIAFTVLTTRLMRCYVACMRSAVALIVSTVRFTLPPRRMNATRVNSKFGGPRDVYFGTGGRMATRKKAAAKRPAKQQAASEQRRERHVATFPYTTRPGGLRKFLSEIPRRPRPTKVNVELLAGWGLSGSENYTIVRVLKAVALLNDNNEPTDVFAGFMRAGTGPAVLGAQIRRVYAPLFEASHAPHRESAEDLRNLFNIHAAGGAAATIDLQIQTFKALCDSASFEAAAASGVTASSVVNAKASTQKTPGGASAAGAAIHVDLHIHLPPGKTSRDYQYIIQDIARYLYGMGGEEPERKEEQ